jgi:hypothetical protein
MGRRWTEEDIDELKEMARHYRIPEIAEKIDRTVGSVVAKAHELKISLRSSPSGRAIVPGAGLGLQE